MNPYYFVHLMCDTPTAEPVKHSMMYDICGTGPPTSMVVVCSPKTVEVLDGSIPYDFEIPTATSAEALFF